MKKTIVKLMVSVIGLASMGGALFASQDSVFVMHVPFEFVAGGKRLPAGDYRFASSMESGLVMIQGFGPGKSMMLLTAPGEPARADAALGAKFQSVNGEHHLASVINGGQAVRMVTVKPVSDSGPGAPVTGH